MQMMNYKFRLYPDKKQSKLLYQFCGTQRFIWNRYLALEQKTHKETKKFNFGHKNITSLPKLKTELEWLKDVPAVSLQQTLLYLDRALKHSFRKTKGFPKFKKKSFTKGSFSLVMITKKSIVDNKIFKMPKVGNMKIVMERDLPSDFKSCKVLNENGKWFVVFTVNRKKLVKVKKIKKIIGLDFNSKNIIVDSDGNETKNPKFFTKTKKKLKKEQRKLSKRVKNSVNKRKQQMKVSKVHAKVSRQRKDFLDKLSYKIIQENDLVCIEDLNVASMSKFNGKMVHDAGWSMLRNMIEYKAELYGKHVSIISRWFPSTKICSSCGTLKNKKLSERNHICECGLSTTRDHNAAMNIMNEGLTLFTNLNRAGTVQINACGDLISRNFKDHFEIEQKSLKQESAKASA